MTVLALGSPAPATPPASAAPTGSADSPGSAFARVRWLLRLHRPALYLWAALVVVLALGLLWLWGPLTDAAATAWRQYHACGDSRPCAYDRDAIGRYKDVYDYTTLALVALPFLVAPWAGAALFGRELEHGTAQLAWTQNVSPVRWLATKLAVPAVLVATGTGLLVALHRLAWSAGEGRIGTAKSWYDITTLHANSPVTVALALTGLAGGAFAGLLLRRTLPALTLALGLVVAARVVADEAMPHLWPAVTRVSSLTDGYLGVGLEVDSGLVTSTGAHLADPGCGATSATPGCVAVYDKLDATGFYTTYHPQSHYWPLQLTTTALVLAFAAVLTVAAFALLRRSTATRRTAQETQETQEIKAGAESPGDRRTSAVAAESSPRPVGSGGSPAARPVAVDRDGGWGVVRTVLRLHRASLVVWAVTVVGLTGWLVWLTEVTADKESAALDACDRASQDWCDLTMIGLPGFSGPAGWICLLIGYSFLAVAAFAGGSLIGRELENGTAHLAWTQGVSPARWLAAKLAVPAAVLTLGTAVLVLTFRWTWSAYRELLLEWMSPDIFLARGPATLGYALCALAVGALAGLLLRRALPALGVSVAAIWLLNLVLAEYRASFWPTVTRTAATDDLETPLNAWQLENGALIHGHPTPNVAYWECNGSSADISRCLDDLGVTGYYVTYHPASHFWPLQLVETGILLAVAALATFAAFRVLRRRTAAALPTG
ncbi:hypothetical protein [Streptomyces sp. NBC_01275]|uniref:hypothetical protein n=1 Tax=Streptomyces sp. NBC_01275 TaxID=2903807 RepID=UPI002B1D322E|nr:hypothetical protein [Streptomyces sp. NBC_01275]